MNETYSSTGYEMSANMLEQLSAIDLEQNVIDSLMGAENLTADEKLWMENLVQRIFYSITDIFHESSDGIDSEYISPVKDICDHMAEGYGITDAAKEWHRQESPMSCAICCQQFIINEFLDLDLTEQELTDIAEKNGWYTPTEGTPATDIANLLTLYGIDTQTKESASVQDIVTALEQGGRIITSVDSTVLNVVGTLNYPWTGADHAIEVIGIDTSTPSDVKVIINDPGVESGYGKSVSLTEFQEAWQVGGSLMVSAYPND